MNRQKLVSQIRRYVPYNEQEEADKALILNWIEKNDDAFLRDVVAHMTASAWVVDKDRSKVLMVYHNIYHSWSWLGGHADGETDLLAVAIREVKEEAGISDVRPVSEEIFRLVYAGGGVKEIYGAVVCGAGVCEACREDEVLEISGIHLGKFMWYSEKYQ